MTESSIHPPLTRPGTLAEVVRRASRDGGIDVDAFRTALAEFLDAFHLDSDPASRRARIDEDPGLTGERWRDASVGAVGEDRCYRWNLGRTPTWTEAPERFLHRFHFMGPEGRSPFFQPKARPPSAVA